MPKLPEVFDMEAVVVLKQQTGRVFEALMALDYPIHGRWTEEEGGDQGMKGEGGGGGR
jgi:hypothetical protein